MQLVWKMRLYRTETINCPSQRRAMEMMAPMGIRGLRHLPPKQSQHLLCLSSWLHSPLSANILFVTWLSSPHQNTGSMRTGTFSVLPALPYCAISSCKSNTSFTVYTMLRNVLKASRVASMCSIAQLYL